MATSTFEVVRGGEGWTVRQDTGEAGSYATREAAFEAILGPASNALRTGDEVVIRVAPSDGGSAQ